MKLTVRETSVMGPENLIAESLIANPELKEAIAAFEIARILVPYPVHTTIEPISYSNTSRKE